MQKLRLFLHVIDNINDRTGKIISFLVVFIVACVVCEVVCRSIFNAPTIWAHELSTFLYGAFIIMGGGYTLRHKVHVNVDIVYARLSQRRKAIIDLLTFTLFFSFCVVLIWYGGQVAWKSLLLLETTETIWEPPIYPLKLTIPIAAFLLLLQGLAKFIRDLTIVITDKELL